MKYQVEIRGNIHETNSGKTWYMVKRVKLALELSETTELTQTEISSECGWSCLKHMRSAARKIGYNDFATQWEKLKNVTKAEWHNKALRHQQGDSAETLANEIPTTKMTVIARFRQIGYDVQTKKFNYRSVEKLEAKVSMPSMWQRVLYNKTLAFV